MNNKKMGNFSISDNNLIIIFGDVYLNHCQSIESNRLLNRSIDTNTFIFIFIIKTITTITTTKTQIKIKNCIHLIKSRIFHDYSRRIEKKTLSL